LVESGLLSPGQQLWAVKGKKKAMILSNGKIKCEDRIDTIHGMAKALTNTPANGWDFWLFEDADGVKRPIDELRTQFRKELGS
jgi:modification methylase